MKMNGGFLITKIKQLGDRTFEKLLAKRILMHSMEPRVASLCAVAGGWNHDWFTLNQMRIGDNISYDDAGKNGKSSADKSCSV